ncbi:MAG: ABC-2 family transporter protein [Kofleriaceae bacterium]|nr:ABC-2 family transporter protein [Myxococcales bacterium]MCB9559241.1 ABC-2 family transporter protein [Kofleriaceae bacterium]
MRRTARAMPALLRIGFAETVAYRAEFVIWMLTTTMPLVMLGLWTSVAAEAPFRGFGQRDFVAYYLATLIVRNVTSSWVVWQINEEIRQGNLSMRLLRPIHPFASYAATHLSAVPLRTLIAIPMAVVLLVTSARDVLATSPVDLALFGVSLIGAWVLTFFVLVTIGTLAFWVDRSMGLFDVYMGVFAVLSGYLIPLALLPGWMQDVAAHAPFRYMLSVPVEILIGRLHGADAAWQVVTQLAWATAAVLGARALWKVGVRRYEAYGA